MKVQADRNFGLIGGWLISVIGETMPGYWELRYSLHITEGALA